VNLDDLRDVVAGAGVIGAGCVGVLGILVFYGLMLAIPTVIFVWAAATGLKWAGVL
jgi:hypothetical protein